MLIIIVILASASAYYFSNRHIFMSLRQMLETGYVFQYGHRSQIRGQNCRSCDGGVIQFKDLTTLVDLMDDEDPKVQTRAKWAFKYLVNRHLMNKFGEYTTDEEAVGALDAIKYFIDAKPDHDLLTYVYHSIHSFDGVRRSYSDFKNALLGEARALFGSICEDVWGGKLLVLNKTLEGGFSLRVPGSNKYFSTGPAWVLHEKTITNDFYDKNNIIPISCFKNHDDIYKILDYRLSIENAAKKRDPTAIFNLVRKRPSLLTYIKIMEHHHIYNQFNYVDSALYLIETLKNSPEGDMLSVEGEVDSDVGIPDPGFATPEGMAWLKILPKNIQHYAQYYIRSNSLPKQGVDVGYAFNKSESRIQINIDDRQRYSARYGLDYGYVKLLSGDQISIKSLVIVDGAVRFVDKFKREEVTLGEDQPALYAYINRPDALPLQHDYDNEHHYFISFGINGYHVTIHISDNTQLNKDKVIHISSEIFDLLYTAINYQQGLYYGSE